MENNSQITIYLQAIKKMNDRELLVSLKNRDDYTNEFLKLAEKEAVFRGYDYQKIQFEDIDKLIFQCKTTDELIKIVSDKTDFYDRAEVAFAISELEERDYNLLLIDTEIENKKAKVQMRGNVSGSIETVNGTGMTLYGKMKQEYGTYIATKWLVFLFIPLIPIASYLVLNCQNTGIFSKKYELVKVPMNWKQIGITYLITLSVPCIIYLFFTLMLYIEEAMK